MRREATCQCQWAAESAKCKVLIEPPDLILRGIPPGAIHRRIPLASLREISVQADQLHFHAGQDRVVLTLGADQAAKWANVLTTPPPTLAAKLGIQSATRLRLIGEFDAEELLHAISSTASIGVRNPDMILASVRNGADLNHALDDYALHINIPPIWIIYPKGSNKSIGENEIRSTMRQEGFIDTKVASVSSTLTGLRFIKRS